MSVNKFNGKYRTNDEPFQEIEPTGKTFGERALAAQAANAEQEDGKRYLEGLAELSNAATQHMQNELDEREHSAHSSREDRSEFLEIKEPTHKLETSMRQETHENLVHQTHPIQAEGIGIAALMGIPAAYAIDRVMNVKEKSPSLMKSMEQFDQRLIKEEKEKAEAEKDAKEQEAKEQNEKAEQEAKDTKENR